MDTTEALKRAMRALKEADIPESLWPTALPLALADLRGMSPAAPAQPVVGNPIAGTLKTPKQRPKAKKSGAQPRAAPLSTEAPVLSTLPDEHALFAAVAQETGVSTSDLGDLFHIESGRLQIKASGRHLGSNVKAGAQTIAALLTGVMLAGTDHRRLPFKEINEVCRAKNVYHDKNSSTYIKATPGFAPVGTGSTLALTSRTGWQKAFSQAVDRSLQRNPIAT